MRQVKFRINAKGILNMNITGDDRYRCKQVMVSYRRIKTLMIRECLTSGEFFSGLLRRAAWPNVVSAILHREHRRPGRPRDYLPHRQWRRSKAGAGPSGSLHETEKNPRIYRGQKRKGLRSAPPSPAVDGCFKSHSFQSEYFFAGVLPAGKLLLVPVDGHAPSENPRPNYQYEDYVTLFEDVDGSLCYTQRAEWVSELALIYLLMQVH